MTVMCDGRQTLSAGRAARELELRSGEFELAVQLGEVRTLPAGTDGRPGGTATPVRRRVPAEEIARLQAEPGFPEALRERIRTVGTNEAAALMGIGPGRALRLTRAGCFGPVRFYVNRYGAVVWLYLASEVAEFADREPGLLRGAVPTAMRVMLEEGQDWRARQWRSRRVAQLMGQTEDPWESAAAIAAVLPPEELASVADNPLERTLLRRLRPTLATVLTATPAARETVERVLAADEFDEVLWYRVNLARALEEARSEEPARLRAPAAAATAAHPAQPSSFLNSPSWTTETSSLPSRS
ncbi:hypothetical protein SSP35_10_01380 [Streptomyces sp. NBRC 110611]|uniref:DUF6397 family protein n=1 Tax=Streptomyces sp. NBRC 110611 TaxID=1621259 RepID=UPI0008551B6F|nr:DUF6397 family protein [Streptomyces sp. NBRC 110611]GAU69104.1 hypothetical protein SSP35_10_01380 [Streptomyces sp. NBRC 110611]